MLLALAASTYYLLIFTKLTILIAKIFSKRKYKYNVYEVI